MKKVIYSCITGEYDYVREPNVITPGWDYIMFTNNVKLTSKNWEIRGLLFETKLDNTRYARKVKINPFDILPNYDLYFWCDANLEVSCNLDDFVNKYMDENSDLAIMKHHMRSCIYQEAIACMQENKDNKDIIKKQMEIYMDDEFPTENGLVQTGVHIKKPTTSVKKFMELWLNEILEHSKRDQLSFNYVDWKYKDLLKYNTYPAAILWNEFKISQHNHGW